MNSADLAYALSADLRRQRRLIATSSPRDFARIYLPQHFSLPPSPMHADLFSLAQAAASRRGQRIALAAPRGHAKSTVLSLACALWAVLLDHDRYVLITSATTEQAAQLLRHIKDELETNALLQADFPELYPRPGSRRPSPWRGTKLLLPNGSLLHAAGVGQQIRGLRNAQHRPSLIIGDDLETPELVTSEERRDRTRDWFERTLLKTGDPRTNVFVVGTVLHHDALLARLLDPSKSPGWTARLYRALAREPDEPGLWSAWENIYNRRQTWEGDGGPAAAAAYFAAHRDAMQRGAEVLWPERDPLEALMEMRVREGRASFESEKQNTPISPERCVFDVDGAMYWDDEFVDERALLQTHQGLRVFIGWDPSLGKTTGDHSAIVVIARRCSSDDTTYVIAADIERRPPNEAIARLVEYARLYRVGQITVESNGFQELLRRNIELEARSKGIGVNVRGVENRGDKRGRIELLEPALRQGRIRLSRRHRVLIEQLRQFPLGKHDDGPDALQMVYEASRYRGSGFTVMG